MNKMLSNLNPAINIEKRLGVSLMTINEFCQRWHIQELALFGSILRADFRADSDIDFLVTFSPEVSIGMFELYDLEKELKTMVKREIDLVSKNSIEGSHNPIRRRNILGSAEVIYVQR